MAMKSFRTKAFFLEGIGFDPRTKTEGVERATLPYQPKPLYEKEKVLLLPQSPSVTAPSSEGACPLRLRRRRIHLSQRERQESPAKNFSF